MVEMKINLLLMRLFSFNKYPRYIADLYIKYVSQAALKRQGISLGKNISWLGRPIITQAKNSSISIGEGTVLCSRSAQTALGVNHPVIIRTIKPQAILKIGSMVRMSGTTICSALRVEIGDRCVIGANAMILDTDFHAIDPAIRSSSDDLLNAIAKPVFIGNDVFIGGSSMILKGVTIGNGAVIGAGSVVIKDVLPGTIAAGNPAKPIGMVKALEI